MPAWWLRVAPARASITGSPTRASPTRATSCATSCASNWPTRPRWRATESGGRLQVSPLFALEALGFGALIGMSLGALGAGGSILTVPILVYAMGVPVQNAAGTSLAVVGLNALIGALDHLRHGRSLPKTGIAFGLSGLLAALAGAWLNHLLRAE